MPRVHNAVRAVPVTDDRRTGDDRVAINTISTIRTPSAAREVVVEDLSSTGFRFRSSERFAIGTRLHLGLAGAGMAQARILRAKAGTYGCEFLKPLDDVQVRQAFSGTLVLAPDFLGGQAATLLPYRDERYSGLVRVVVALSGALVCWAGVAMAGVRLMA